MNETIPTREAIDYQKICEAIKIIVIESWCELFSVNLASGVKKAYENKIADIKKSEEAKGDEGDFVTEYYKKINDIIIKKIQERLPGFNMFSPTQWVEGFCLKRSGFSSYLFKIISYGELNFKLFNFLSKL